jgi:TetR/AcrR family transcriptional repressor of nem operon
VTGSPKTKRGQATRERIVEAASALIGERGVAETSLDDVIERAGVSKSQLYHYFEDRRALLRAVVVHNADGVLGGLAPLRGWKAIRSWFDSLVELQVERRAQGGCPVGSLVAQLAEADEHARLALADSFARWEAHLRDGFCAMQEQGKLDRRADPEDLATATMAAVQGGLLLTQTNRDPSRLAVALDAAYAHLRTHAVQPRGGAGL